MFDIPVSELAGKTVEKVMVYSDMVQIAFTDGVGAAVVVSPDGALHLRVGRPVSGGPAAVSVYPGLTKSGKTPF